MTDQLTPTPAPADASPSVTPAPSGVDGGAVVAAAPAAVTKPEGLDDRFFDPAAGVKWADLNTEFKTLAEFKAAADAAKAAVPEKADGYSLDFGDALQAPEGFVVNPDDPKWPLAREVAHELGLDQAGFTKLAAASLKLQAAEEAALTSQLKDMQKTQAEKLGPNAAAIADATTQWINANFEPEAAQVLAASNILVNASVLKSLTKVITAMTNSGISLSGEGRTVEGGRPANFSSMTFMQQRAWQMANGITK